MTNEVCPYQLLVDFQSIISIGTVKHLIRIQIGQRLDVFVEASVDLGDNLVVIGFRVGFHKEPQGEEVTVLLVELSNHSLLRVETRILLLVGDFGPEFVLGGVIDLSEPSIPEE